MTDALENIHLIGDFAISVFTLIALIYLMRLMYKIYQVCVRIPQLFNYTTLRESIIQIERFCQRYANIGDSEMSLGDFEELDKK